VLTQDGQDTAQPLWVNTPAAGHLHYVSALKSAKALTVLQQRLDAGFDHVFHAEDALP
jgi:hypothetical protein